MAEQIRGSGTLNGSELVWTVKDNRGNCEEYDHKPTVDDLKDFKNGLGYTTVNYVTDEVNRIVRITPKDVSGA